jgi:hypothetical protein
MPQRDPTTSFLNWHFIAKSVACHLPALPPVRVISWFFVPTSLATSKSNLLVLCLYQPCHQQELSLGTLSLPDLPPKFVPQRNLPTALSPCPYSLVTARKRTKISLSVCIVPTALSPCPYTVVTTRKRTKHLFLSFVSKRNLICLPPKFVPQRNLPTALSPCPHSFVTLSLQRCQHQKENEASLSFVCPTEKSHKFATKVCPTEKSPYSVVTLSPQRCHLVPTALSPCPYSVVTTRKRTRHLFLSFVPQRNLTSLPPKFVPQRNLPTALSPCPYSVVTLSPQRCHLVSTALSPPEREQSISSFRLFHREIS